MIINKTKRKVISEQEIICDSFFSQVRGLMFRRSNNLVMIFPTERKISLHMFFVLYPIDVLVVDENNKIVEIKRNFKPFTVWNSSQKGKYVIELANNGSYEVGDLIDFLMLGDARDNSRS